MFHRILALQQHEYGAQDRRCQVTIDKIKMVQSQGIQYAVAIKELSNTFAMPVESVPMNHPVGKSQTYTTTSPASSSRNSSREKPHQRNKVLNILNSMRKKKP
jgi:hypothetical protein